VTAPSHIAEVRYPLLAGGRHRRGRIPYQPFGKKRSYRMIVRRVAPTPGSQLWLKGVAYSHFAFITDARATCWSWRPTTASTRWSRT
jgi:hypothetical protein